jgi:Tfp pilus assembly protein PilV
MSKQNLKIKNLETGQSLFEVTVSLAISALIIVSLVSLVSNSIRNSTFSKNKALAATFAQEGTEWLRGQRDTDVNTFFATRAVPGLVYCLNTLSWDQIGTCADDSTINGTPFKRELNFPLCDSCSSSLIESDVVVSWTDSQGLHQVTSATNFADWRKR